VGAGAATEGALLAAMERLLDRTSHPSAKSNSADDELTAVVAQSEAFVVVGELAGVFARFVPRSETS